MSRVVIMSIMARHNWHPGFGPASGGKAMVAIVARQAEQAPRLGTSAQRDGSGVDSGPAGGRGTQKRGISARRDGSCVDNGPSGEMAPGLDQRTADGCVCGDCICGAAPRLAV